jgi:hypothetical protein
MYRAVRTRRRLPKSAAELSALIEKQTLNKVTYLNCYSDKKFMIVSYRQRTGRTYYLYRWNSDKRTWLSEQRSVACDIDSVYQGLIALCTTP